MNMEIAIQQFSQQSLKVLREEIQTALDQIKTRYGLSELALERIHFAADSFTSKITGKIQNPETKNFEQNEAKFFAIRHGLPVDFFGSKFIYDGGTFTITRLIVSRPKYPITAQCEEDGRIFKFTVQLIKELLKTHRVIDITPTDITGTLAIHQFNNINNL
ncbi:MAG: hypothetical protein HY738_24530 [Bacteroidia bacterium]|nr:hypothetical protein [Bacteroidia bacterium]